MTHELFVAVRWKYMTQRGRGRGGAKAFTGETFYDPLAVSGIWHAMEHKTSENTKLDTDVCSNWNKNGTS